MQLFQNVFGQYPTGSMVRSYVLFPCTVCMSTSIWCYVEKKVSILGLLAIIAPQISFPTLEGSQIPFYVKSGRRVK